MGGPARAAGTSGIVRSMRRLVLSSRLLALLGRTAQLRDTGHGVQHRRIGALVVTEHVLSPHLHQPPSDLDGSSRTLVNDLLRARNHWAHIA